MSIPIAVTGNFIFIFIAHLNLYDMQHGMQYLHTITVNIDFGV